MRLEPELVLADDVVRVLLPAAQSLAAARAGSWGFEAL